MHLTLTVVVLGTLATAIFGISKTAVPAVGSFGAALLATVLPPLASTGVVLPVLIVGDLIALGMYSRHVEIRVLLRLLPAVTVGLVLGYWTVRSAGSEASARVIGAMLLISGLGELLRRRAARVAGAPAPVGDRNPVSVALGAGAGFSTMVANAGGPMMTLYLLRLGITQRAFLGTVAWFFFVINVLKVPLSVGLGLITPASLVISAALVPGIVLGSLLGRRLAAAMSPEVFATVALVATSVAGLWLVVA
ncbi:sulfite exporter TauE/SafE family protein [Actinotalea sp.]|uniref:sulfite exporter TauE/SafE family protein n=1 Tax=Actinotalea sp. TaxID=1872145 RepID=UPI00356590EA